MAIKLTNCFCIDAQRQFPKLASRNSSLKSDSVNRQENFIGLACNEELRDEFLGSLEEFIVLHELKPRISLIALLS